MEIVIIDTRQIQSYIFGSNRLRENIGASYLVKMATEDWVQKVLAGQFPADALARPIEDPQCPAKPVFTGGGNAVLFFRENGQGKTFIRQYSRAVLACAPHLQLATAVHQFDKLDELPAAVDDAFAQLDVNKQKQPPDTPLLGMGVTVKCRSTGLAAMAMSPLIPGADDGGQYPVSAEILAKLRNINKANKLLDQFNPDKTRYDFPYDLDNLGRSSGEQSYVAVVHIDGNDMGQRIKAYKEGLSGAKAYLVGSEQISEALNEAGKSALQETVSALIAAVTKDKKGRPIISHTNITGDKITEIALKEGERLDKKTGKKAGTGNYYLPFRPIVFGGDDITFVCDGRLGISLALTFTKAFEAATENFIDGRGKITACAGVAIVKSHYPFARAYDLAESLCRQAKMYRRRLMIDEGMEDVSCLDWHFALSGLLGSLSRMRKREYCVPSGHLTLRPVTLTENFVDPLRAWPVINAGIRAFQDTDEGKDKAGWSTKRNKVKALRDALRQGPEAVDHFRAAYRLAELPRVTDIGGSIQLTGWHDQDCVYFDALELADWHMPLPAGGKNE
ncbi:MAG TPA: hypothetical protein ENK32_04580 [Anaerolineae bacterium]|nr:hypothetical protein [Anaerolineae bacterium]